MPENFTVGTGALPSPADSRDWTLASAGAPTTYPKECFIDVSWMKVSMQGKIGCCVGCTGEEVVRNIVYLMTGQVPEELSWRFIYALAKTQDGAPEEGTYPSLVAKLIRKVGVPLAKYCPNDVTLDHETFCYGREIANIPAEAFRDAEERKSGADFTVPVTLEGIKQAVNYAKANKGGVMILRRVGDTYWTGKDGIVTWDKAKLLPIRVPAVFSSGHEEFLYGYDEEPETGRVRLYWLNHWSDAWADKGKGWEYADEWLPYIVEIRVVVAEVPVVDNFRYTFTKSMKRGDKGADIVALQHALKLEGCYPKDIAFTGYFGTITEDAVRKFQVKYFDDILKPAGLTAPTGIIGRYTLAKINALYHQ